jgi:hypothetical protein
MKAARARSAASVRNVGRRVAILPWLSGRGDRKSPVRKSSDRVLSTVARRAGGPARSSGQAPVIGVERRGRVVRDWFVRSTGSFPGGAGWTS